jgi:hypothetical protein
MKEDSEQDSQTGQKPGALYLERTLAEVYDKVELPA